MPELSFSYHGHAVTKDRKDRHPMGSICVGIRSYVDAVIRMLRENNVLWCPLLCLHT